MGEPAVRDNNGVPCLLAYEAAGTGAGTDVTENLFRVHVSTRDNAGTTEHLLLVSDPGGGGGGGGPTTVTANQGNSGAQAWPVQISGSNTVVVSNTETNTVTGTVSVNHFPASQAVAVTNTPDVGVTNFPASVNAIQSDSGTQAWPVQISGSNTVIVSNTETNTVTGTVSVNNFPASQAVAVTNDPDVGVTNFPTSVHANNVPDGHSDPSLFTTVTLSVTSNVAAITSPGDGSQIWLRGFHAGNGNSASTVGLDIKGSTTIRYAAPLANSGGGFVRQFVYPMSIGNNVPVSVALGAAVNSVVVNFEYFTKAT
jgi:hypothetical protein